MSDNSVNANVNIGLNNDYCSTTVCVSKPGNGMSKVLLIDECADHDIPKALKTLMSSLENPTITDLTVVLLYIMTVETGFTPSCCVPLQDDIFRHYDVRRLNALAEMPPNWKQKESSYEFTFFLQPFPDRKCHLICNKTMERLSVSMFFCDTTVVLQTFSMLLNPADYVDYQPDAPKHSVFKNLKQLSVSFKNQIPLAVRCCVLDNVGLNHGLLALPEELLYQVFDYLDAKSFLMLTSTCKFLYDSFSNDSIIWKRLVTIEFGELNPPQYRTWKSFYKTKYANRRIESNLRTFINTPIETYSFRSDFM